MKVKKVLFHFLLVVFRKLVVGIVEEEVLLGEVVGIKVFYFVKALKNVLEKIVKVLGVGDC